jgi:pimeloyl-ACP methyl ester carboxylesterase
VQTADRLDYFEQPVHRVGYSMGGHIAALTALKNQNRIASLTLIVSACDELSKDKFMQHREVLELIKKTIFRYDLEACKAFFS